MESWVRVSKIFIGNLHIELHRIGKSAWRDSCNFKKLEHKKQKLTKYLKILGTIIKLNR